MSENSLCDSLVVKSSGNPEKVRNEDQILKTKIRNTEEMETEEDMKSLKN